VPRLYSRPDPMAITPGSPVAPGDRLRLPPRRHAHHDADQRVGVGEMSIENKDRELATRRWLPGGVTPTKDLVENNFSIARI
jgi:hypothetical protein